MCRRNEQNMTIRERIEQIEADTLSPYACLSINSKGRDREEPQCDIRPVFQRDRDRILHSKSFRRLKSKTQVFLTPMGDHYRTRLTHTLEVSQNARTIAKALRLNEDLVEAIALGHDLGHTPFGHAGEFLLNQVYEGGFRHNEQSVRIVEKLEKDGEGLGCTGRGGLGRNGAGGTGLKHDVVGVGGDHLSAVVGGGAACAGGGIRGQGKHRNSGGGYHRAAGCGNGGFAGSYAGHTAKAVHRSNLLVRGGQGDSGVVGSRAGAHLQ